MEITDKNIMPLLFAESKKVSIVTHINPDGDALGSAIALAHLLNDENERTVRVFTPNRAPSNLNSIDGFNFVTDYIAKTENAIKYIERSDLIICVDFSDYNTRTGDVGKHIAANKEAKKILFDHHVAPDISNYDLVFSDEGDSSTAHVILRVLLAHGYKDAIDKKIATSLFTGMMTDTGNFSYGNLSPELYRNISILIEKHVDPTEVNNRIFNVRSENSLRLNGYAIEKKMIVSYPNASACITLTAKELQKFGYKSGDTEGLVNMPLAIKGIYNSALFVEQDGFIKVSLRSVKGMGKDVNSFARKFFNGGGHINAAGGRGYATTLEDCAEVFIRNIEKCKK